MCTMENFVLHMGFSDNEIRLNFYPTSHLENGETSFSYIFLRNTIHGCENHWNGVAGPH